MGTKRKRSAQNASAAAPPSKKQNKSNGKPAAKVEKKSAKAATKTSAPVPIDTSPFVNDPKGSELKREVQLYDILSSEDVVERLNAANAIVSGLLEGEGVEESTLQRHLERRLFRGLASGRKAARLGFSVVLTEILGQLFGGKNLVEGKYAGLTFEKVLGFLVAKTKPDGDLSGQEEKDHHFGMLFGLESFVRAKILFGDDDRWNQILRKLLELAKKKPWIKEECGWVIVEALAQMDEEQTKYTLDQLVDFGLAMSPEGVGIWLTARNRFPSIKLPSKPWGKTGNPLDNLQSLAKALKESSSAEENNVKTQQVKSGSWNPRLHFVWGLVLSQYAAGAKSAANSDFEHFWKVAVDDNLFSATASRERKYWGFLLFQKVLQEPKSYGQLFGSIFSHNLVRCIINHVQQEDRFLNRAADKSLKILVQAVESNSELLSVVLPRLIGGHGIYGFDKITKTKTVEKLLSAVDGDNVKDVIQILVEPVQVIKGAEDLKDAEVRRLALGDYLLTIIRKVDVADNSTDVKWVNNVLSTIANIAYTNDPQYQPPPSEKTRTLFRNRLSSAFTHLLADLKAFSYPCNLLQTITPDAIPMDEAITASKVAGLSTMEKIVKKIKKAEDEFKPPLQALALLYSLVIFQLYNGEPEALSVLDELKLCYDKLIRHKDPEDADVEASEVLVELSLSFISKPSALLRKVTEHVFAAFMSEMTEGGLKLMTDVLESDESLRGQQALFDQEPEDANEMDVDDNDEDDDLDSDVEVVDMEADEGHLNGHLDESDNDEDDEEEEEEEDANGDDEEGKKLDEALALALGTHKIDPNAEEESDSDADMTDSEMMALDSKLVEIFSQRKKVPNKKQEQKDAKETMVNFKSRILDLLDIYVKKSASSPLAFGLLLPLLQLIRTTKTKQLAEKSHSIISAFAKALKSTKSSETGISDQIKLLKTIHLEASKDPSHVFSKAASSASLLVSSSVYKADKGAFKKIANVYRDSQVSWVEGEVKMQAAFFVEWVNWCQSHAVSSRST